MFDLVFEKKIIFYSLLCNKQINANGKPTVTRMVAPGAPNVWVFTY